MKHANKYDVLCSGGFVLSPTLSLKTIIGGATTAHLALLLCNGVIEEQLWEARIPAFQNSDRKCEGTRKLHPKPNRVSSRRYSRDETDTKKRS